MQTGDKMQTAVYLRILYSHFLYGELSALVSLKCTDQVGRCLVSSISLQMKMEI